MQGLTGVAKEGVDLSSLSAIRPQLHRYCARMLGSSLDGEDVVQDVLLKAVEALPKAGPIGNLSAWLFRIAHNRALDVLRARARLAEFEVAETTEAPDLGQVDDRHEIVSMSLRTLARLPVRQRSCVILMDVIGHSLKEIGDMLEISVPAVKAELHRGRKLLRDLALEPEERPVPRLSAAESVRLLAYVERFNARDFAAIRDMLAEEVRIEAVARTTFEGRRDSAGYFGNYEGLAGWTASPVLVDGHPAALVQLAGQPSYFILLEWSASGLKTIRDFYYARYALETAAIVCLPQRSPLDHSPK
jgi:RNA polymerase sigma-70 factor, ECF subfamily